MSAGFAAFGRVEVFGTLLTASEGGVAVAVLNGEIGLGVEVALAVNFEVVAGNAESARVESEAESTEVESILNAGTGHSDIE